MNKKPPHSHLSKEGDQLSVNVNSDHIARGWPRNPLACPVALAIRECFPCCDALVNDDEVIVACGGLRVHFSMSIRLQRFLNNFDKGRTVSPKSFRLRRKGARS